MVQPLAGLEQKGFEACVAAQENRYSFAAVVVTAAEDHAVVAVSESWKPDWSSGVEEFSPATSATATNR